MRALLTLLGVALLFSNASADSDNNRNNNGRSPQFHNAARHAAADPYVFYDSESGQYYAYSTEGADEGYHFAVYISPDLSTWHKHPGGVLKACYDDQMKRVDGGQACWARDWYWAPETYYNEKTGWYFFVFAGRLREDLAKDHFQYSNFEEPSKLGIAVSRSPTGPFKEIKSEPIGYYPFDPDYHDVNLIMDDKQMLPPDTLAKGKTAPKGTYIPTIDPNIFFDKDGRIYLYASRNAYRNWNWDDGLGKYIEESNIIVVEMDRRWWDDPFARTMPEIASSQINFHAGKASALPKNITAYNGTGEIGNPPRKDGWKTVISYGADPQDWENFHVEDYVKFNGTKKNRRWSEGSTIMTRKGTNGKPVYLLTYSANNYEASNYGVGYATSESPLGPFRKSSKNPVLSQAPDGEIPIYSTGHGSIVASPPRNTRAIFGAQDVTWRDLEGAELFYVHHARNDTTQDRSIYTTRMTLNKSALYFGSDGAISMSLTPLDQPLPRNTDPIQIEVGCSSSRNIGTQFVVRVSSKAGAPFDLTEGSNRVVGLPDSVEATSIEFGKRQEDGYVLKFNDNSITGLAYQRLGVRGKWATIARADIRCRGTKRRFNLP
ncbi:glycoside hydrolase family 43 [Colletotrichum incanum]|uniref:Glycoside hydrolase family 43 n=1 Tax=Colletotrichum incanum TaxID=1573173 RepID=A0A166ZI13_COLIC|nr:glycoside hydrolase family 43 [Colletotrichum incanum]